VRKAELFPHQTHPPPCTTASASTLGDGKTTVCGPPDPATRPRKSISLVVYAAPRGEQQPARPPCSHRRQRLSIVERSARPDPASPAAAALPPTPDDMGPQSPLKSTLAATNPRLPPPCLMTLPDSTRSCTPPRTGAGIVVRAARSLPPPPNDGVRPCGEQRPQHSRRLCPPDGARTTFVHNGPPKGPAAGRAVFLRPSERGAANRQARVPPADAETQTRTAPRHSGDVEWRGQAERNGVVLDTACSPDRLTSTPPGHLAVLEINVGLEGPGFAELLPGTFPPSEQRRCAWSPIAARVAHESDGPTSHRFASTSGRRWRLPARSRMRRFMDHPTEPSGRPRITAPNCRSLSAGVGDGASPCPSNVRSPRRAGLVGPSNSRRPSSIPAGHSPSPAAIGTRRHEKLGAGRYGVYFGQAAIPLRYPPPAWVGASLAPTDVLRPCLRRVRCLAVEPQRRPCRGGLSVKARRRRRNAPQAGRGRPHGRPRLASIPLR